MARTEGFETQMMVFLSLNRRVQYFIEHINSHVSSSL